MLPIQKHAKSNEYSQRGTPLGIENPKEKKTLGGLKMVENMEVKKMTSLETLLAMGEKTHREISWEEIDSHWDDEKWVGWELLWFLNPQCARLNGTFTPLKIKALWGPLRRSYRREKLYLEKHPKLRWVREPKAYLEERHEKPAPDFEHVDREGNVCFTVELKWAHDRKDAVSKRQQLDKVNYEKGMKHPYSSHGADVVVFTNLEEGKRKWFEWHCYKDDDGAYPRINRDRIHSNAPDKDF